MQLGAGCCAVYTRHSGEEGEVCIALIFREKGEQFSQALRNMCSFWYLSVASFFLVISDAKAGEFISSWIKSEMEHLEVGWVGSGSFRVQPHFSDAFICVLLVLASSEGWCILNHILTTCSRAGGRLLFLPQWLEKNTESCARVKTRTALQLVCTGRNCACC